MEQLRWFLDPVKNHYFDFEGRVTRQTFWMFVLWSFILSFVIGLVSDFLSGLFSLAVLLPSLGLGARRLHDIGKSGWWQLIGLIPIIGWIAIIIMLALQGKAGPNEYGADPRQSGVSPMPAATTTTPTPTTPVPASENTQVQNPTDTEQKGGV